MYLLEAFYLRIQDNSKIKLKNNKNTYYFNLTAIGEQFDPYHILTGWYVRDKKSKIL